MGFVYKSASTFEIEIIVCTSPHKCSHRYCFLIVHLCIFSLKFVMFFLWHMQPLVAQLNTMTKLNAIFIVSMQFLFPARVYDFLSLEKLSYAEIMLSVRLSIGH